MPSPTQKLTMFRTAARYLTEPHPFARKPITMKPHAVDYSLYVKRVGRTGALYVDSPFQPCLNTILISSQRPSHGRRRTWLAPRRRAVLPDDWSMTA